MNDFLQKNWPEVVVLAVIIFALTIANTVNTVNQPGKGLLFKKLSQTPLGLGTDIDFGGDKSFEVLNGGKVLVRPYLTTIMVKNTGVVAIDREDYETPIQVLVENDSTIVRMQHECIPRDINSEVTYSKKRVTLAPALLNPGDIVVIRILTEREPPQLHMGARIKGVQRVVNTEVDESWGEIGWLELIFFFIALLVFLIFASKMKEGAESKYVVLPHRMATVLFVALGLIMLQDYFGMVADHAATVLSSRLFLLAVVLVAFLLAWVCKNAMEGKANKEE